MLLVISAGIYVLIKPSGQNQNTLSVPSADGSKNINVSNNFLNNPVEKTPSSTLVANNPLYQVIYFGIDKSFLITLLSKPLKQGRADAEQALLAKLNISQSQACNLKISVNVTNDVDQSLAGRELGLSFCANATVLP